MNEEEIKKEFRERFSYANFTWSGVLETGIKMAKKQRKEVEDWWLSKLSQQKAIIENIYEHCPQCVGLREVYKQELIKETEKLPEALRSELESGESIICRADILTLISKDK